MLRFWKFLYGLYYRLAHIIWELPRGVDFLRLHYPKGADIESLYYQTASRRLVKQILKGYVVPSVPMLDVGCGKGYFIYCAKRLGMGRVDGLEKDAELAGIAQRNMERCGLDDVKIIHADAKTFADIDDYQILYFFNPFIGGTMRAVLGHIEESLRRRPRHLLIIYNNPVEYKMFDDSDLFYFNEARVVRWVYRKISVFYYIHENTGDTVEKKDFQTHLRKAMLG